MISREQAETATLSNEEDTASRWSDQFNLNEGYFIVIAALIDEDARINANVTVRARAGVTRDEDGANYVVRDGVVVIPKNTSIADCAVI